MKKTILLLSILSVNFVYAQKLELKWKTDTVFRVPESVYLDTKNDILYVSNIDGKSDQKDGKGFISKLTRDGKVVQLQWVGGLNAPKGMGVVNNHLYVADLTAVAVIDITSGKVVTTHEIEGAKFLNDVTTDESGSVYISDSGAGKIYKMQKDGKPELFFESAELKRVNGLLSLKDGLYIADAGTGVNYTLKSDKKLTRFSETSPGADGIVMLGKEGYIVSSWGGEVFFVDAAGKSQKMLDTKEQKLNSADIAYDSKTKTVFVPTFSGNSVMAYTFSK
jgi:DNA-binding beta-propeller fold protein YncE